MDIKDYVVLDLEMTGLSPKTDKITEIGAIKVRDHRVVDQYEMLVNAHAVIPDRVIELTGITNEMIADGIEEDEAIKGLVEFIGDDVIVGQNIQFDYNFIKQWAINRKEKFEVFAYDTLKIARKVLPPEQSKTLEALCEYFEIPRENAHRALADTVETQILFEKLMVLVKGQELKLEPKKLTYKAKRQTPATAHQIQRLKETIKRHDIKDSINWESLTRNEASRLQDKYYAIYGRAKRDSE